MAKPRKAEQCDDNTERPLIALIEKLVTGLATQVQTALGMLGKQEQDRHEQIMTALEELTASVTKNVEGQAWPLTTAVNAAIVKLGSPSPTDAQLLSLKTQVDTSTESDAALTTALNNAVTPPPEP